MFPVTLDYMSLTHVRSESILAEHRGRFYVHKLNAEFNIDASFVGNGGRYINHAKGREANCVVQSA